MVRSPMTWYFIHNCVGSKIKMDVQRSWAAKPRQHPEQKKALSFSVLLGNVRCMFLAPGLQHFYLASPGNPVFHGWLVNRSSRDIVLIHLLPKASGQDQIRALTNRAHWPHKVFSICIKYILPTFDSFCAVFFFTVLSQH